VALSNNSWKATQTSWPAQYIYVTFFIRCASQCSTLVSWLSSRSSHFISRFPFRYLIILYCLKCPFCCHKSSPCSLNLPRSHSVPTISLSLLRSPVFFAFQRPFLLPQYRIADEWRIIYSAPHNVRHCVSASLRHLGICAKSCSSNWQFNSTHPISHTLPSKSTYNSTSWFCNIRAKMSSAPFSCYL
jgi:hypothetical protein